MLALRPQQAEIRTEAINAQRSRFFVTMVSHEGEMRLQTPRRAPHKNAHQKHRQLL